MPEALQGLFRKARERVGDAGDKPELHAKIDTLALLQFQRGQLKTHLSEHQEFMGRAEKVLAEQQVALEEIQRNMEELRAMAEGRLHRIPSEEDRQVSG